ncbi:MAG: PHP domain-containing protein [Bacillota bacterium]|nr:PHP domain-containing protein [Bacillota bacterium]
MSAEERADLHAHTRASDGTLSPAELVAMAARAGLAAVAVTDHDTVAGWEEALEAGLKEGVQVVPGIEVSSSIRGRSLHILGYFPDKGHPALQSLLTQMQEARRKRIIVIMEKLRDLGVPLTEEELWAQVQGGQPGRMHVARALAARGVVSRPEEAFARFLSRGRPAFVPKPDLPTGEVLQKLRAAGALTVWAHPGTFGDDTVLPDLLEAGLEGIEALHPDHRPEERERYLRLAKEHRLMATGGTDFHSPEERVPLGTVWAPLAVVEEILQRKKDFRSSLLKKP